MTECIHERDLVEAILSNRWPDGCHELKAHVQQCAICADVLIVAQALHQEREDLLKHAPVPSAGLVWWRSELRARQDAIRTATKPMRVFQAFGAASVAGVGVALAVGMLPWFEGWVDSLAALPMLHQLPFLLTLGAALVLAPFALYLAFSRD